MPIFTFIVDHRGGTYLAQAVADDVESAIGAWAAGLREDDFGGLHEKQLEELRTRLTRDDPTPVTGLIGVWCISTLVGDHLMLVHIVGDTVERFAMK